MKGVAIDVKPFGNLPAATDDNPLMYTRILPLNYTMNCD